MRKLKNIALSLSMLTLVGFASYPSIIDHPTNSASAAVTTYTYEDDWSTITYSISGGYALISNVTLKNNSTYMFVPQELGGYDVALGYKCFNNLDQLENANISNAKKINSYAFYKCNNLKEREFDRKKLVEYA